MKILLIVPSLRNGGAERVAANLSRSFEQKGLEVLVVTFSKGTVDYPVSRHLELGIESSKNIIKKFVNVLRRTFRLKKIKKEFKPDASISFMFGANLVNALTKRKTELTINSVHSTIQNEDKFILVKPINSFVYRISDFVVPVSKGIRFEILEKYKINPDKVKVIYNFVDLVEDVKTRENPRKSINLITIGGLVQVKAQWHLFHAVNILKDNHPNLILKILGQGELLESYKRLISELKLEQHVSLLGFQQDVGKYLRDSDIFLFSSKHEGFGNVIIEAMNLGLPIVSTGVPHGPREILNPIGIDLYGNDDAIVEEKYGLLVDYGSNRKSNDFGYRDEYIVNQFVEKITLLIKNEDLYEHYSKQSLKRVRDFSEVSIVSQWIELFEEGMKHS